MKGRCTACTVDNAHPTEAHTSMTLALEMVRDAAKRGDRAATMRWIDVCRGIEVKRSKRERVA